MTSFLLRLAIKKTYKASQKGALAIGLPLRPSRKSHVEASGNTLPGPTLLGAVALATITAIEPMTWEKARVAHTCNRDSVCRRGSETESQFPGLSGLPVAESYPIQHPGQHQEHQARAKVMFRDMAQQLLPMEYRERETKFPTTSGTISGHRDRRRKQPRARCEI